MRAIKLPTIAFELVTPEEAGRMLAKNRNRTLRAKTVAYLASAMVHGEYLITHQGIAIDAEGFLIDGQHRLNAIIASKKAQWIAVTRGLDPKAYSVLDCGLTRTLGDRLGVNSREAGVAATMLRVMYGDSRKIAAWEAQLVLDGLRLEFDEAYSLGAGSGRQTNSAAIVCAAILRLFQYKGSSTIQKVRSATEVIFRRDIEHMKGISAAFYKQVLERRMYGTDAQVDLFARAWIAFDPERSSTKLSIKNPLVSVEEAKKVFHEATADNFKPTGRGK